MKNDKIKEMLNQHSVAFTKYAMQEVEFALASVRNEGNKEKESKNCDLFVNSISEGITSSVTLLAETLESFFNVENTKLSITNIEVMNELELLENFTSVEDILYKIHVKITKSMTAPYTMTLYFSGLMEENKLANRIYTAYNVWNTYSKHTLQNEVLQFQLSKFVQQHYSGKNLLIDSSSIRCGICVEKELFIEVGNINFNQHEGKLNVYTGKLNVEVKNFLHSDITHLLQKEDTTDSQFSLLPTTSRIVTNKVLDVLTTLPKTVNINNTECTRIIEKVKVVDFTSNVLKVGVTFLAINESVNQPVSEEELIIELDINPTTYAVTYITSYKKTL